MGTSIENVKVRTVQDWIERASSQTSKKNYGQTLKYWTIANGFSSPEDGIERIRCGATDPYESADRMVKHMMDRKLSPLTVKLHRGVLPRLFEFLSPKLSFEREEYDRAVRKTEAYKIGEDQVPTREEAQKVLLHAPNPKSKAFNAIMICTGRRINEVSTLRVRDVDFSLKPVRVAFRAARTKMKKEAMGFLSAEAAEIVQTYLKNRGFESQWLFPGSIGNKPIDRPLAKSNAWRIAIDAFRTAGLDQKDEHGGNVYHPHVWRKYASNQMRSAGLNEAWVEWIVGWGAGSAKSRYPDWEEIAKGWGEKCEAQFTFLTPTHQESAVKECCRIASTIAFSQQPHITEEEAHVLLINSLRIYHAELFAEVLKRVGTTASVIGDTLLSQSANGYERIHQALRQLTHEEVGRVAMTISSADSAKGVETKRFANHEYDYIKTTIGSDDYDQALIAGYQPASQNGSMAYLRKARQQS